MDLGPPPIRAVIFDLDGVLTDTAEYHFQAWRRLATEEGIPFGREDNEQLRGVSRRRSLEILLKGRAVSDGQAEEMMARKNRYYQELIAEITSADLLPGVVEMLDSLRAAGVKIGIATVSRNSQAVLAGLGIRERIDALSDGYSVQRSKPSPDLFLHAAGQLQVPPSECLVVEDAAAGIDAAQAAGMLSLALGPGERFAEVQPDALLLSLDGMTWERLVAHLQAARGLEATWTIAEGHFDPTRQRSQESVFTIGNGYLGTRGSFEERYPGDLPATLVAGLFDGTPIVHTELAGAPDWLSMRLVVAGEPFSLAEGQVLACERRLSLRDGLLARTVRWRSPQGRTVEVQSRRWASMADVQLLALQWQVTALDFEGDVELRAEIDGVVENPGFLAPQAVGTVHWHTVAHGNPAPQTACLHVRARMSGTELCTVAHLAVEGIPGAEYAPLDQRHAPGVIARFHLRQGETAVATKLASMATSKDGQAPEAAALARLQAAEGQGYASLLRAHRAAWRDLWRDCDLLIEGDDTFQRAVRFNLYHLLIAAPRHTGRVSIPAKTLSGFGYRGHVFWDTDIFVVPFFTYTRPELARNLLLYRYHTLPAAHENARQLGYEGAMFAWESAEDGRETTPRWIPLPDGSLVRIWCGDIEHHITADVAYAVWRYWQVTGDDAFMRDYGAELLLDTATFWGSRVGYDDAARRYEIADVIGPDEYHEHVDNNVYTNRMAQWHLHQALQALAWLRECHAGKAAELEERLGLSRERLAHWEDVGRRMFVPADPATGLVEQFQGFFGLQDLDLKALEPRTRSVQLILGVEGVQKYQVVKQADVLMLMWLLGDEYDERTRRANWLYYEPRTDHTYGSSLGPAVHALLGTQLGYPEAAYEHLARAALVDLEDLRGNTADGIHAASAGGLWQAVTMGFGGLALGPDGPVFTPRMPRHWRRLSFTIRYRGRPIPVDIRAQ